MSHVLRRRKVCRSPATAANANLDGRHQGDAYRPDGVRHGINRARRVRRHHDDRTGDPTAAPARAAGQGLSASLSPMTTRSMASVWTSGASRRVSRRSRALARPITPKCGRRRDGGRLTHPVLCPQQSHPVEDDEQGRPRVRRNSCPQRRVTGEREDDEQQLHSQREDDVLADHAHRPPAVLDQPRQTVQVVGLARVRPASRCGLRLR